VGVGSYGVDVAYEGDDVFASVSHRLGEVRVVDAPVPSPAASMPDSGISDEIGAGGAPPPVWRSVVGSRELVSAGGVGRVRVSVGMVSKRRISAGGKLVVVVTVLGKGRRAKVNAGNVGYLLEPVGGGVSKAKAKVGKAVKVAQGKGDKAWSGLKRRVTLTGLAVGSYKLRLGYVGDGVLGDAVSKVVGVRVSQAVASVKVNAPRSVSVSDRVRVDVAVRAKGLNPTGKVVVSWGKGLSKSVALKAKAKGRVTVKLPTLARGSYTVKAVYTGSAKIAKKSSGRLKVVVT
jgi:hypothetical protein